MQVRERCGLDPHPLPSCYGGDLQLLGIAEVLLAGEGHPGTSQELFCTLEPPALPTQRSQARLPLVPYSEIAASARSHAELDKSSTSSICSEENVLPSLFAQYVDEPCIDLPSLEQAESAPQQGDKSSTPLLAVPAVLPDHSSVTVRQRIWQALLESIRACDVTDPHPDIDLSEGLTFHDMIAPGQVRAHWLLRKRASNLSHRSDNKVTCCLSQGTTSQLLTAF